MANRRTMMRLDSSDAAHHIHIARAICEERLHLGGAACTQLTSLTDTRTTALAKPAAEDSQMQVGHNPRVKSVKPQRDAMASFQRQGRQTEPLRRRRDRAASKEDREGVL